MAQIERNDYTDIDFDSIRQRLIQLAKSGFPEWSDFDTASFGNMLIEMFAFVGDTLGFYLDNQARETRLSTATQRKNVIALARMLGYKLQGASAATAEVQFKLRQSLEINVTIPKGTQVRTQGITKPVQFQLLSDVLIVQGATESFGNVEHSNSHDLIIESSGTHNLDISLPQAPYLENSARVVAANGPFEERESLLNAGAEDRFYTVLVNQDEKAILRFGNGITGAVPMGKIRVAYKTGGGSIGNVEARTITILDGVVHDNFGRPVPVDILNPNAASGGSERESIVSAKSKAPLLLRANHRSVSREDFETHACRLPQVERALMLTRNELPAIEENTGILFVIPKGGGLPTYTLKQEVLTQVTETYPCPLTFHVRVQNPVYKAVDVAAQIVVRGLAEQVQNLVQERLVSWFNSTQETPNPLVDFGAKLAAGSGGESGEITWSDIFNVIRDTAGVRKVTNLQLCGSQSDVHLQPQEFPILGSVTIEVA